MESMERTFQLAVPSSTENLSMIRDFVGSIGERAGMNQTESAKLVLAVDEACANVIEHAYGEDNTREVKVRAVVDPAAIQIEIVDNGPGWDPTKVEQLGLEELMHKRSTGGVGMRLMKSVMDEVQYQMIPGQKNELRMVKRLKKA